MSRRYTDPVEVRLRADEPVQFLWRGRLYVVRGVLAHWVEVGAWWRGDPGHRRGPGEAERQVWRVEAAAGRASAPGIYDLCQEGVPFRDVAGQEDVAGREDVAGQEPAGVAAPVGSGARWSLARSWD